MQSFQHNPLATSPLNNLFTVSRSADKIALSENSVRWGALPSAGTLVILVPLLVMLPIVSFAQTEFEGEISGEWDTDGSPYIQTGDAEIPAEQSLTILPGVEVVLGEDLTITCNGLLTAVGTEEDTIRIHGPEGMVAGLIRLNTDEDTIHFQYCRFDSLYNAIWSDNWALSVENCRFLDNYNHLHLISRWVYVTDNHFVGSDEGRGLGSFVFGGINDEDGTYAMLNNEILGGRASIQFQVDNAEFIGNTAIPTPGGRLPDLHFYNCRDVVCNGNAGWFPIFIGNSFRRLEQAIFEDNDAKWITVYDQANWGVVIRNNRLRLGCGLHDGYAEYYDNIFGESEQLISSIRIFTDAEAILERNLLSGVRIGEDSDIYMRNNTIMGGVMEYQRAEDAESSSITIINNIFQNFDESGYLILPAIGEVSGGYNCFWGKEQPYGEDRDLLEGDIVQNPLMRGGLPYDYRLRADSPCIDAGDPDSPDDPDGTRADIGDFYFDQENGEPPAIDRRWDYYIGWGETFRYAARAVDEGEELQIELEGLPEWLEIEEEGLRRDFVRDSVVVSGEVPEDQEDFVFRVIATDDADREDTLSVRVMVYPYRVLTGVVRGVLDIEQSPFIIVDTAWVPAGDSLVLPPGTELYFDNREDSLADRAKSMLMVMGAIKAVGEEEDSIYFAPLDTTRDNISIYYGPNEQDFNLYRYCIFDGMRVVRSPIENSSRYLNSSFRSGRSNLQRINGYVRPFEFSHNVGDMGGLFTGSGTINDNNGGSASLYYADSVEVINNNMRGLSVSTGGARGVSVRDNVMGPIILGGEVGDCEVRDNRITGGLESLKIGYSIEVSISNNLIISPSQIGLRLNRGIALRQIFNNVFIDCPIGIYHYYEIGPDGLTFLQNNLFFTSDTLVKMRQGGIPILEHSAFYDIGVFASDTTYLGSVTGVNANGDSCDAYLNIYLDPRLANPDSLDFRLYNDSPLIDAGNPDSPFNDVDSTINDIGLYGGPYGMAYEYLDPNEVLSFDTPPRDFHVGNAYPNPFNATSHISIDIPYAGKITFSLFDIQGRRVAHHSLQLTAGSHRGSLSEFLNMDISGLRSGLYVLTVEFGRKSINRKLVLVK